jgi:PAS domain S-box-containing protein
VTAERDLLRSLVDHLSSMVAYWDSSLRCRFANRAYEKWFGVPPEKVIGMHLPDLLGPTMYESNRPYIEGVLRGEPQEFEGELADPEGGRPRHGLACFVPDIADDGEVRGFYVMVTDVSAVKGTEAALRESEQRFGVTLDEAPIGMALVANDGRFFRVNRALCEIVGYSQEELTGLTFHDITHPDDLDADLALLDKLTRGEIPRYQLDKRYIRKDGSVVDITLNASVVRDRDGTPLYYIAQIEDVSARKRVERELRESEERVQLALEGADLGSWDWNVKTGAVVFNSRWAEMRGYRLDEIAPHVESWTAGVHPDDWFDVQRALNDHFDGKKPMYEVVHRVRCKSGDWIWILDRGKVSMRDETGRPIRMVGTELDVTVRKRAEDEHAFLADVGGVLAGSIELDKTLTAIAALVVRQLADCVIIDLVEDDCVVRRVAVVHADPTKAHLCEELKRFPLDRARPHLSTGVFETRQPVLIRDVHAGLVLTMAQNEKHLELLRALEIRSMLAVPLLARERILGAILCLSSKPTHRYGSYDVWFATELANRAALALDNAQLYERARRATALRDEVLGIVAHDLRNPLSTILVQGQLIREGSAGPVHAHAIIRAAKRMNRLIEDLLDVTRMEAKRFSVKRMRLHPAPFVADFLATQQPLAASSSVTLRGDVPSDLPDVWADRDRILQVLENLVGNAVKFTPAGGEICVGAVAREESEVLFYVADTGRGIPPDEVPHVFDRFWQSQRAGRSGAGLGLAIVKGLVEAHGGRIWVESTLGHGTTIFFTLPCAPHEAVTDENTLAR